MKGVYCYIDDKTNKVVYVGQDGNIDKNRRHRDHTESWSYDYQQINRIIQNNPNRYSYHILAKGGFTTDELNKLEQSFIRMYNTFEDETKFNYTIGGDCQRGETHPSYKPGMRILKNGKGVYAVYYKQKYICYNNDKDFLQHLIDKFNNGNLNINELKELNKKNANAKKHRITKQDTLKHSLKRNKLGYFRVTYFGGRYCYTYQINNKKKYIYSKTIEGLRDKVKLKGLDWIKFNKEAMTWFNLT